MKILVTGATGFIGKHLCQKLKKAGHETHLLIRGHNEAEKLSQQGFSVHIGSHTSQNLTEIIKQQNFDGIVHLASCFIAQHTEQDIDNLINSNLLFSTKLIEAANAANCRWFLNTGTFWQHYKDAPYSPVNLYAATKQAFETIAQFYIETSNTRFSTIKLNDTYGPNDTRKKIFALWEKIAKSGETLEMSPGEQIIDIVYIDDVINGYIKMIELLNQGSIKSGSSFCIRAKEQVTLKQLAEIYTQTTSKKLNIVWGGREYRHREVMQPWSNGRIVPGWEPKIDFKEGIQKLNKQD